MAARENSTYFSQIFEFLDQNVFLFSKFEKDPVKF